MARSSLAEALGRDSGPELAGREHPVPRISIAAFSSSDAVASSLERAAADRRLMRAHFTNHRGGARDAARHFAQHPAPDLLLVECPGAPGAVLGELNELAEVCEETTKAVVIGHANDVQLYRQLMRNGVSEYLLAPVTPLQIIDAIAGLYSAADTPPLGKLVAFTGTRGGAGASTLAHNFAWLAANDLNVHTTIVDLDLAFGTAALNFNQDAAQGLADALSSPDRIDDVLLERLLVKCGDYLSLLPAPAALDQTHHFEVSAVETLIDRARAMSPCVVADLPMSWTDWSRHVLHRADEIVIVATPELASLRNCKNLIQAVQARRVNDAPARLILNQVGVPKRREIPLKDFSATVGKEPDLVLPFDSQLFGRAANNGQMLAEIQPKCRTADSIRRLAQTITGRQAKPAKTGTALSLSFLGLKSG